MPVFRTKPSSNLFENVRRAVAASRQGISPLEEAQAEAYRTKQEQTQALTEKARMEVEEGRRRAAQQRDPGLQTEFASHAAGMSMPEGTRLMSHLKAELEQPSTADYEDASIAGREAQPFPTAAPVLEPGQRGRFQGALAAAAANLLGTGKTNADQLAHASDRITKTALTSRAAEEVDLQNANRLNAAASGRVREPFRLGSQGQVLNEETGDLDEGTELAQGAAGLTSARTETEAARQRELGERSARAAAKAAQPRAPATRETAMERNLKHLVAIGAAPDQKSALTLLRRSTGKSEQDTILGLSKTLMQRPAYMGKDGPARAMADATDMVRSAQPTAAKPPAASTFRTAEDVRAAYRAKKIDRATALRELEQFGFDAD